ncbi:putative RNA recognition motif domain, nucleotide-binding alpha-beta plait domain superfamily [Helianthus debilis subsp. tardiflorus]
MDAEDDSWEVQNSRRRGKGNGAGFRQEISKFFVTNIPQGCRPWDLANAFRIYGEIAGAFIAKKKDKVGRTFGFVSFKGVRDLEELKCSLSNVKLGVNKLEINVALYAKENGNAKSVVGNGGNGGKPKMMGAGQHRVQEDYLQAKVQMSVKSGASFLDVLTNTTQVVKEEDVLVLDPSSFSLASYTRRGAVGRTLGIHELRSIKTLLKDAGFEGACIQYLGGLSVLIAFDNEVSMSKLLNEKETWGQWFSSFQPWIGQALHYERLAWVNILGVPPHLVSRSVFNLIGSKYGKVVFSSQFLESDGDLSFDRLGILLDSGNRINGLLNLCWQDKRYKVWVIEDNEQWIPDFLDDDEDSAAASSELGDVPESPVIEGSNDKEDEEISVLPDEEAKKSMENRTGNGDVHVPMQENDVGGGYVSEVAGDKSHGEEGQSFDFNIHVTKSVCQTGGSGPRCFGLFQNREVFFEQAQ